MLFLITYRIYLSVYWYSFCKLCSLKKSPSIFSIWGFISIEVCLHILFYMPYFYWCYIFCGLEEFFWEGICEKASIMLYSRIKIFYSVFSYSLYYKSLSYFSINLPKSTMLLRIFSYWFLSLFTIYLCFIFYEDFLFPKFL